MQENMDFGMQENLHERTNNPRFGDGQIPDLAKSAQACDYKEGLADAFDLAIAELEKAAENIRFIELLSYHISEIDQIDQIKDVSQSLAVLNILKENISEAYFQKLDKAKYAEEVKRYQEEKQMLEKDSNDN